MSSTSPSPPLIISPQNIPSVSFDPPSPRSLLLPGPVTISTTLDDRVSEIRTICRSEEEKEVSASSSSSPTSSSEWKLSLVYGEMKPHAVASLLKLAHSFIEVTSSSDLLSFADLGSGEGWPVILGSLLFPFKRSIGIELIQKHAQRARRHLDFLQNNDNDHHHGLDMVKILQENRSIEEKAFTNEDLNLRLSSVEFLQGSFLDIPWSHCELVFCNATAFEGTLLTSIYLQSEGMRPGSILILTTQKHTSKLFELVHEGKWSPSWDGDTVTARIYRRKKLPKWVSGVLGRPRN